VFKPRTISLLFFLVMGLFVAQWQGFSHGIAHGLAVTQSAPLDDVGQTEQTGHAKQQDGCHDHQAKHHHAHNGHQSEGKHHCAAYDSQTLSMALPALPMSLPVIDKTNAAINSYTTYQASIEAYRPFDVRGPPNS
jgi:ABC-type Zn2+ transport system substrate-binding protein/surface adhesin